MVTLSQNRFSHKLFEPAPLTIAEADTHCVVIFEKLRLQREQGRFCDVILKVHGREFPAHRCVLASCSPWFDTKLKVHKTMKEIIEVDSCKNYEVFHRVLTYMYTGQVVIDRHNVADILEISHNFLISKLKGYCSEYLERNLKASNCLTVIELSEKYHLVDLSKQTVAYIHKHFEHIIQYHELEKKSLSDVQQYINRAWFFPSELVLRLITRWISQEPASREEHLVSLLHNINWTSLDPIFIGHHLDSDPLYSSSPESLLTILHVLDKNSIKLSSRFNSIYRDLQAKLLPDNDLDQELDDSNSFLSIAINSAVLEHSEVDETFSSYILQPDPMGDPSQYAPYRHPSGTEMESAKNDDSDAASPVAADLLFNAAGQKTLVGTHHSGHAGMKRETDHPGALMTNSPDDNFSSAYNAKSTFAEDAIEEEVENLRVGDMDPSGQPAGGSAPCVSLSTPGQYDQHLEAASPVAAGSSLAGYRASSSQSCEDGYGNNSLLAEQYYRSDPQQLALAAYLTKDMPTTGSAAISTSEYETDQSKCMENLPDGGPFNQELFKSQTLGREEVILYNREDGSGPRNSGGYAFPRESTGIVFQNDLETYRNLYCQPPQPPSFDAYGSKGMADVRADYDSYPVGGLDLKAGIVGGPAGAGGDVDQNERQAENKLERLNSRSDFDFTEYQILEQVINEQRLSERSSSSTATKRYDPKYRALAEAFKQSEPEVGSGGGCGSTMAATAADLFPFKIDTCLSGKWERSEQNTAAKWDRVEGNQEKSDSNRWERPEFGQQPRWDKTAAPSSSSSAAIMELNYLACRLADRHPRLRGERPDCQYQDKIKDFYSVQEQPKTPTSSAVGVENSGFCHLEPRETFDETLSLGVKNEQQGGLFLSSDHSRDGRITDPEEQASTYEAGTVPPCSTPQPFLNGSFNEIDYSLNSSHGEESLFPKSGPAVDLYAEEDTETARQQQGEVTRSGQHQQLGAEMTETSAAVVRPPVVVTPPQVQQETARLSGGRSHASMVFLTPKEKYAKEVSAAERKLESVQRKVVFEVEEPELSQTQSEQPQEHLTQQPDTSSPAINPPAATATTTASPIMIAKLPLAFKILQAKKKMATQKKLILEHGEVRLTYQQRCRLVEPFRKRAVRALKTAPVTSDNMSRALQHNATEVDPAAVGEDAMPEHRAKRIFNRKDKLLAEHRRKQVPVVMAPAEANKTGDDLPEAGGDRRKLLPGCEDTERTEETTVAATAAPIPCPFCSHTSQQRKDLYKHIKEKHLLSPPYRCPKCEYEQRKISQLLAHYHTHSASLSCSTCGHVAESLQLLRKHRKCHAEPPRHVCQICLKVFTHHTTLEQHQAVHTSEKKFKCKQCTFSTKYSSHLTAHRRVHDGNVHRCYVEGCQYWTPKLTLLKAHLRAHNGDKNFKCATCGKAFVEAGQLRRHEKTHSKARPFICGMGQCGFATNRKDKLKNHQARVHKPEEARLEPNKRPSKLMSLNRRLSSSDLELSPNQIPFVKEEILGF